MFSHSTCIHPSNKVLLLQFSCAVTQSLCQCPCFLSIVCVHLPEHGKHTFPDCIAVCKVHHSCQDLGQRWARAVLISPPSAQNPSVLPGSLVHRMCSSRSSTSSSLRPSGSTSGVKRSARITMETTCQSY